MVKSEPMTRTGVTKPKNATAMPYGERHLSDFMDVWDTGRATVGIDHLFYPDGSVELRVMGYRLEDLP